MRHLLVLLGFSACLVGLPVAAHAQCAEYSGLMRVIHAQEVEGRVLDLDGNEAWVADGPFVHRFDLSTPSSPVETAVDSFPVTAVSQVVHRDSLALVYSWRDHRILAFQIPSSGSPVPRGFLVTSKSTSIGALGNGLFVAVVGDSLLLIEVPWDGGLSVRSTLLLPAAASIGAADGSLLCLTQKGNGFQLVDLSDPDAPRLLSQVNAWPHRALALRGDWLYLVDTQALRILSIADRVHPQEVASLPLPGLDEDIGGMTPRLQTAGSMLFVLTRLSGHAHAVDVTDPVHPQRVGVLSLGKWTYALRIERERPFAYAINDQKLSSLDISQPENLRHSTVYSTAAGPNPSGNGPGAVFWMDGGTKAVAALGWDGLGIFQARGDGNWRLLSRYSTDPYLVTDLIYDGRYAYLGLMRSSSDGVLTVYSYKVEILDLGDPTTPQLVDDLLSQENFASVNIRLRRDGRQVAVSFEGSNWDFPTHCFDRLDGEAPHGAGFSGWTSVYPVKGQWYQLGDHSLSLMQVGNFGLEIARTIELPHGGARWMIRRADLLYVLGGGIQIFDISDPENPRWVSAVDGPHTDVSDAAVSGNLLALPHHAEGLSLYDLSNPLAPKWLGVAPPENAAVGVSIGGRGILVADPGQGILEYPLPCGTTIPVLQALSEFRVEAVDGGLRFSWNAAPSLSWDVFEIWRRRESGAVETIATVAYAAPGADDPQGPKQSTELEIPVGERSGFYSVVGWVDGVMVRSEEFFFRAPPPAGLLLRGAVPNPFNPSTEIFYYQPVSAWTRLTIFDTRGRRVWSHDQYNEEGWRRVRWDGTDQQGAAVASGSYQVLLEVEGKRRSARITLLR